MSHGTNDLSWTWNSYRNKVVIEMDHDTTREIAAVAGAGGTTSLVFGAFASATGIGAVPGAPAAAAGALLMYFAGEMLMWDDGHGIKLTYHIYNGFPVPFYDIEPQ